MQNLNIYLKKKIFEIFVQNFSFDFQTKLGATTACCGVCLNSYPIDNFRSLSCGHLFCMECWQCFLQTQLRQGISSAISCMEPDCPILLPEDFALDMLKQADLRAKYQNFAFQDHVKVGTDEESFLFVYLK